MESRKILLTLQETADICSVSKSTVRRWVEFGGIRAFKDGQVVRIRTQDLEEFTGCKISSKLPSSPKE
jgi:excisionase family DNA binding protein